MFPYKTPLLFCIFVGVGDRCGGEGGNAFHGMVGLLAVGCDRRRHSTVIRKGFCKRDLHIYDDEDCFKPTVA